ncbi:MAG: LPS export ABC transporter periplasmic protein LptC [Nitrospirota bacterium]
MDYKGYKLSKTIFLSLIAMIVISLLFLLFFDSKKRKINLKDQIVFDADIGIEDFSFFQNENEGIKWKIAAKKARVFKEDEKIVLTGIKVQFNPSEDLAINFEGEEGYIDTETKDFFVKRLKDKMKINLSNGYTLYTNSIKWEKSKHIITTDDTIHIIGNTIDITGKGLIANAVTRELIVMDDVHVQFKR